MNTLNSHVDIDQVHSKLLNLGLLMNVLIPAIFLCTGAFLRARVIRVNGGSNLNLFFVVLIVVALGEIPVIYIVRRNALGARKVCQESHRQMTTEQSLFQWGVLIFSLSLSPTIYGLVYYFVGGTFERFVLFAAITLLCFMLFKPKEEEIRSFVQKDPEYIENAKEF